MELNEPSAKYLVQAGYKQTEGGLIPVDWSYQQLTDVARLESGHTPSRRQPSYWGGDIPWISLHDTGSLNDLEILATQQYISQAGLKNSSARLLPKGTVVLSRTATVGKATSMGREMATSQDFANYVCGPAVDSHFLVYLFRYMAPEWRKLMAGSIHNTVYMPTFKSLRVVLPPKREQESIAQALQDADALIESLEQLLVKKRRVKHGAMQELLSGQRRLPGFSDEWTTSTLGSLGCVYGGLSGKSKKDFGHGSAFYIPFMNVMNSVVIDSAWLERVDIQPNETQNDVKQGDLLFNGSSETPEEVGMCSVLQHTIPNLFLNSFCFGFRLHAGAQADGTFLAYWFRSAIGRSTMSVLAQGATRYNIAKSAFVRLSLNLPARDEQTAIATVLSDIDTEITALEARLIKAHQLKQGMAQALLTGRIRLV